MYICILIFHLGTNSVLTVLQKLPSRLLLHNSFRMVLHTWDSTSPNSATCLVQPLAACSYLFHIHNIGAGFLDYTSLILSVLGFVVLKWHFQSWLSKLCPHTHSSSNNAIVFYLTWSHSVKKHRPPYFFGTDHFKCANLSVLTWAKTVCIQMCAHTLLYLRTCLRLCLNACLRCRGKLGLLH